MLKNSVNKFTQICVRKILFFFKSRFLGGNYIKSKDYLFDKMSLLCIKNYRLNFSSSIIAYVEGRMGRYVLYI